MDEEKLKEFVIAIKPLCVRYINATHLLTNLPFLRSKAGKIYKADLKSREYGTEMLLEFLMDASTENKWIIFFEALEKADFDSIIRLRKSMKNKQKDFSQFCSVFELLSSAFTDGDLDVKDLANEMKKLETISEKQFDLIDDFFSEGKYSAAIFLISCLPNTLHSSIKSLQTCFSILAKPDLVERIEKIEAKSLEGRIRDNRKLIIDHVKPRDIWTWLMAKLDYNPMSLDLEQMPPMKGMETILDKLFDEKKPRKWQIFLDALREEGYEIVLMTLEQKFIDINTHYQYQDLIKKNAPKISPDIDIAQVLDECIVEGLLTIQDKEEVESKKTNKGSISAAQLLLEIIPRKKQYWYDIFWKILGKTGHQHIINQLKKITEAEVRIETRLHSKSQADF